jgi:hypothetical protein
MVLNANDLAFPSLSSRRIIGIPRIGSCARTSSASALYAICFQRMINNCACLVVFGSDRLWSASIPCPCRKFGCTENLIRVDDVMESPKLAKSSGVCFVLAVMVSPFNSKSRLEAENAALRHQLIVLRRNMPGRPWLTNHDRWFSLQMYRWFPSILKVVRIIQPETLVRWHRAGFRCCRRWKSRRRGGHPQIEADLRRLIRRMSVENPLWGAPRIHGELLKLGFAVAQSSVAKYMVKRRGPPRQGWRTFLHNLPQILLRWTCLLSRPSASICSMPSSSCGWIAEAKPHRRMDRAHKAGASPDSMAVASKIEFPTGTAILGGLHHYYGRI